MLIRRPLSSSSSPENNYPVVDLTEPLNSPIVIPDSPSASANNVFIIDSDDDVVEMGVRAPIHSSKEKQKLRTPLTKKPNDTSPPSKVAPTECVVCPVCMETAQQFEKSGRHLMVTRCGHIFCDRCIKTSLRAKRKCPNCRKPVQLNDVHKLFLS